MDRRTFIKGVGFTLAAGTAGLACARDGKKQGAKGKPGPACVAVMTDPGVRKGDGLDASRVASLLERTLQGAFGTPSAAEGLRTVLDKDDLVGIKLNCLAGPPLSPTRETCDALVVVLGKAGIPPDRIVFFERGEWDIRKGGFEVRTGGGKAAFLGNDSPGFGYENEVAISGQVGSCLSRVLTRHISALINLGVLKDHNLAGVGTGMKNLFGLIHNPNKFHDNGCDPFVADVLAFPVVQKKLKLVVIDALTAQCQGGPGYSPGHAWPFNGMIASTDPVALDRVAWSLIEKQREKQGLKPLAKENREPKWIRTAAKRGLGVDDLKRIRVVRET
jgi:hypothetical protein